MIDFFSPLKNFKFDSSLFLKFSLIPAFLFFLGNPAIALIAFNLHPSLSLFFGLFSILGFLPLVYHGFVSFSKFDSANSLDSVLPLVLYGSFAGIISGFLNGFSIYLYFGNPNPLSFLPLLIMPVHGIFFAPCFSLGGFLLNFIVSRKRI